MNVTMEENSAFNFIKDLFDCGSMSTVSVPLHVDEQSEMNSIVLTSPATATATKSPTSCGYDCSQSPSKLPSTDKLKEKMLFMMESPEVQRTQQQQYVQQQYSFSSTPSIHSLICGSVYEEDDRKVTVNLLRESSISTCPSDEQTTEGADRTQQNRPRRTKRGNKNKKASSESSSNSPTYRYTIRLSPEKTNYNMYDTHPELSVRRTQSDSMSTLPDMLLTSSSSLSSISKE